jgi:hypothetical protein
VNKMSGNVNIELLGGGGMHFKMYSLLICIFYLSPNVRVFILCNQWINILKYRGNYM